MALNSILNKIINITDNGLNTAAEMRSVLNEITLEYFPYTGATGNLDLNNKIITNNITNGNVVINPNGTDRKSVV